MKTKNPFNLPNHRDKLSLKERIERNLDLYSDNMRAIASEYGGTLVTDKHLAGWLMAVLNRFYRVKDAYPEVLRPPTYPLEEFIPLQIEFDVDSPFGTILAKKWYFVKRARTFGAAKVVKADS